MNLPAHAALRGQPLADAGEEEPMRNIAAALVYAVTYISLRKAFDDDADAGALESIAGFLSSATEEEKDLLAQEADRALQDELAGPPPARPEFTENYATWMQCMFPGWEGNARGMLDIGFFENFKGEDTLLFAGREAAITSLVIVLDSLASGEVASVQLNELVFVRPHHGVSVLAEVMPASSGLHYSSGKPTPSFRWQLSQEDWEDVARQVEALLNSRSGHQYPDESLGVLNDVRPMVALDEYGPEWWREHG